jgi:hypothetical protein
MRTWVIVCAGLAVYGCAEPESQCPGAPLQTEYTCPMPPDGTGCAGGPGGGGCFHPQVDPDVNFPLGCQATMPYCGNYRVPIVCTCTANGSLNPPVWICREGVEPGGC